MFDLIKGLSAFLSLPICFLASTAMACSVPSNDSRFSFVLKDVPVSLQILEQGNLVATVPLTFTELPSGIILTTVWGTGKDAGWRVRVMRKTPNIMQWGPYIFPGAITDADVEAGKVVTVTEIQAHRRDGFSIRSPDVVCN